MSNSKLLYKMDHFDVKAWLEDRNIPYSTEGRNISRNWIGIQCPFCGDQSNHLGIADNNIVSCWKCGVRGNIIRLIQEVEGCDFRKAADILDEYQDYTIKQLRQDIQIRNGPIPLPPEAHDTLPPLYFEYLKKRRYNPTQLQQKYGLKACPNFGEYAWRVIVPCFLNGVVVNFTALDVTGVAKSKYKHCPNEEASVPMKELLYNIDNAGKRLIVVEGVTDVWRIGDGAVATMGIQFTTAQIKRITQHNPSNVTLMFDAEPLAQKQAEKLAEALSLFVPKVSIYTLPHGDPDDLTDEVANEIRKELL